MQLTRSLSREGAICVIFSVLGFNQQTRVLLVDVRESSSPACLLFRFSFLTPTSSSVSIFTHLHSRDSGNRETTIGELMYAVLFFLYYWLSCVQSVKAARTPGRWQRAGNVGMFFSRVHFFSIRSTNIYPTPKVYGRPELLTTFSGNVVRSIPAPCISPVEIQRCQNAKSPKYHGRGYTVVDS